MTFVQLVRPGAPVVLGSFASSMSMQSGAPTFGTPEPALVLYVMASLARRLGVPFRSGGSLCASKIADAQAAYESAATLQPTVLGGVNFVLHAAGWLEGGLAVGYEKFIMDADQCGMMAVFVKGVDLSENGQALDAIRANGPGQHFLGTAHTLANFETAFYRSEVADNNSFEQWSEDGGLDAAQRANAIWKRMLAEYEAPPLDAGHRRGPARIHDPPQGVDARLGGLRRAFPPPLRADGRLAHRARRPPALADLRADPAQERDGPGGVPAARRDGVGDGIADEGSRGDGRPGQPAAARRVRASHRTYRRGWSATVRTCLTWSRPSTTPASTARSSSAVTRRSRASTRTGCRCCGDGGDRPPVPPRRHPGLSAGPRVHPGRPVARRAPRQGGVRAAT